MFCYRDMTFCNAECGNDECHRKLTDDVVARANAWWSRCGGGEGSAPICVGNCKDFCEAWKEPTK